MGFSNSKLNSMCQTLIYNDLENIIIQSIKYMNSISADVSFIENEITDIWVSQTLMNDGYRKLNNVTPYRFERESQENYLPAKTGKTDIKVISHNSFDEVSSYYIIECKRIDGKQNLNKKYYTNGIKRFVSKSKNYYNIYNNKAMMVMYIKNENVDVQKCVNSINTLQSSDNDISVASSLQVIDDCRLSSKYILNTNIVEIKHFIFKVDNLIKNGD